MFREVEIYWSKEDSQSFMRKCLSKKVLGGNTMDRDSHSEDTLSTMVLENIKNKLIHAFRATGESRVNPQDSGSTFRPVSIGRSYQANEELRRAQIDGAITWLRSELLEMRSQDLQLAQTLLGLNTEIQRLRRESFGGVEVEGRISSNRLQ
ncbi:hypothetical protein F7725_025299 [Dissostichus mawsoni]|uniref:Uncharacterized protein n=1 Tax=Dissostichus mawsoni TaxID=36200 RepID=A0A7J5XAR5_DISMA|nr:hypothetical protein F7725_025299 [Dissostichus mawsoni]